MSAAHDFYYDGAGRRAALDELFEAIHQPGAVICVTGESGSGRTALAQRFCREVDPAVLAVALVTGDILMSEEQCLTAMADALLPGEDLEPAAAVAQVQAQGRTAVLVVDDAHELGERPRAEIARFCIDHAVPVVLLGDSSLAAEVLRTGALIALHPFREDDSEDFIAAWLAVGDEDELPSHRVVERLHRQSAGMPGRLAALLAGGAATRNTWFPAGFPMWHVILTLLAIGLALLLLALLTPGDVENSRRTADEVAVPLPPPTGIVAQPDDAAPGNRLSSVAVPRRMDISPMPARDASATEGVTATPIALPPVSSPLASAPTAPRNPVSARRYTADEDALLKEKASYFTLQLFASFNEQAARQFRAAHAGVDIRVLRTVREELPWYVAVTGSFRNKEQARAAVAKLPPDLRKLEPWARSFQGIQDELRRRKD